MRAAHNSSQEIYNNQQEQKQPTTTVMNKLIFTVFSLALLATAFAQPFQCETTVPEEDIGIFCSAVFNYDLIEKLTADQAVDTSCSRPVSQGDAYKSLLARFIAQYVTHLDTAMGCNGFDVSDEIAVLRRNCVMWVQNDF